MRAATTADLGESLELTDENVEMVLDEIRPYLMAGAIQLFCSSRQYWTCIVDDESISCRA